MLLALVVCLLTTRPLRCGTGRNAPHGSVSGNELQSILRGGRARSSRSLRKGDDGITVEIILSVDHYLGSDLSELFLDLFSPISKKRGSPMCNFSKDAPFTGLGACVGGCYLSVGYICSIWFAVSIIDSNVLMSVYVSYYY